MRLPSLRAWVVLLRSAFWNLRSRASLTMRDELAAANTTKEDASGRVLAMAARRVGANCDPAMVLKQPLQPTDPHLVWGRKQDRQDRRFHARAAIVEHLISCWTRPDWSGVDVSGGAGRWLGTLAPRFSQFTHLDLSPDALRVARSEHPELSNVTYGLVDLLMPRNPNADSCGKKWDAVFCLDTLLYRGDFVESALRNIRSFISRRGIAIIDVPTQFRASMSQRIKGKRYGGPERKFSPRAAHALVKEAGYFCLAAEYQYAELPASTHRLLVGRGLTGWLPWPSTWMYLVLRVTDPP
jgi:SAM-dependent methyltransferase